MYTVVFEKWERRGEGRERRTDERKGVLIHLLPSFPLQLSVSQVFREVTLGMTVDEAVRTRLLGDMAFMKEREYRKACDSRQEVTSPVPTHAAL